jgi:hypothetical protein
MSKMKRSIGSKLDLMSAPLGQNLALDNQIKMIGRFNPEVQLATRGICGKAVTLMMLSQGVKIPF